MKDLLSDCWENMAGALKILCRKLCFQSLRKQFEIVLSHTVWLPLWIFEVTGYNF